MQCHCFACIINIEFAEILAFVLLATYLRYRNDFDWLIVLRHALLLLFCTALNVTCCGRQTEEINQALEDNQVKLSTMKASRFVKAFEHDVDKWERALSLIMEVIEMLLTVQRQWMYLEVRLELLSLTIQSAHTSRATVAARRVCFVLIILRYFVGYLS